MSGHVLTFPMQSGEFVNQLQKYAPNALTHTLGSSVFRVDFSNGIHAYTPDISIADTIVIIQFNIDASVIALDEALKYMAHELKLLPNMKRAWDEGKLKHPSDLGLIMNLRQLFKSE